MIVPDFPAIRAAELEPYLPFIKGNRFARVLAIKGVPGLAEQAGQPPFFGADGDALESALVALEWGSNAWCGVVLELPQKGALGSQDLRMLIEIVDPRAVVALDEEAAIALQEGFGAELLPNVPQPGTKTWLLGRALVCVSNFEAALASGDDGEAKRRVWRELKALKL